PHGSHPIAGARSGRALHRRTGDPGHHHRVVDPRDVPPAIEERPDTSTAALQALRGDFHYFNVAGSGPTFPVAQRAAERFRAWLNEVGMFGHVGYAAYNAALDATRVDIAATLGDPGGAARIALAQSATDGLNTLVAGLAIPPGSLIVTTAEEHGSALYPLRRRMQVGDRLVEIAWHRDPERFLVDVRHWIRQDARALVISLVSCKTGDVLPVAEACRIARDAGAITIVDAAQALGQITVDVHELGADAVVTLATSGFTGRWRRERSGSAISRSSHRRDWAGVRGSSCPAAAPNTTRTRRASRPAPSMPPRSLGCARRWPCTGCWARRCRSVSVRSASVCSPVSRSSRSPCGRRRTRRRGSSWSSRATATSPSWLRR